MRISLMITLYIIQNFLPLHFLKVIKGRVTKNMERQTDEMLKLTLKSKSLINVNFPIVCNFLIF